MNDDGQHAPGTLQPRLLYGTAWKEDDTERCVLDALSIGYRGIDTANQRKHYFEAGVGHALKKSYDTGLVDRSDLFLQTKFTFMGGQDHRLPYDPQAQIANQVQQSFASSLEHLGTEYLDSYLLHGPSTHPGLGPFDFEVWDAMTTLHDSGKIKSLGVSNVNIMQLEELWHHASVKPAFVQNRCFARSGWDRDIREFCRERQIVYQGFSLLTANPEVMQHPELNGIAQSVDKTLAQVIFCFAQQIGILPLTGTTDPNHMRQDLVASEFELPPEMLQRIEDIVH